MTTYTLDELYVKYDIANLNFGTIHDKLGDVYEDFCVSLFSDPKNLQLLKNNSDDDSLEFAVFREIFKTYDVDDLSKIKSVDATNKVPHRDTHGLSKTDIILSVRYETGETKQFAMSCKQSTVTKVAFAEFDVETICREINITDDVLKTLLLKHQTDASAKNFTKEEKGELRDRLLPIARKFVRWVITGCVDKNPQNLVFPTAIVKFKTKKPQERYSFDLNKGDFKFQNFQVFAIEDYINSIMLTKNGTIKLGGFGTGLSWTYATGSKGVKIQFKA